MSGNMKYLDDNNFEAEVAKGVTLVDFYADWCGPCRTIAPVVEELSNEFSGVANVAKVDIENAQKVTASFGVTSIPTIIVLKDGREVGREVGVRSKDDLKAMVNKALK